MADSIKEQPIKYIIGLPTDHVRELYARTAALRLIHDVVITPLPVEPGERYTPELIETDGYFTFPARVLRVGEVVVAMTYRDRATWEAAHPEADEMMTPIAEAERLATQAGAA